MAGITSILPIQSGDIYQTTVLLEKLVPENNVTSYEQRQESQEQEIVMQTAFSNFINLLA